LKKLSPKNGLLMPLNLPTMADYATEYRRLLPDPLHVSLIFCRMPDKCAHCAIEQYEKVHDGLLALATDVPTMAQSRGITAAVIVDHGLDQDSDCGWLMDIPWGRDWAVDGLYAQVVTRKYRDDAPESEIAGGLAAMHNIDMHMAATSSYEPNAHKPFPADSELVVEFSTTVGDMYLNGRGVWSESLVGFRTATLIKMRALLLDLDPDSEYDRFVKVGGGLPVDYLTMK
jgi:hypothetical protein